MRALAAFLSLIVVVFAAGPALAQVQVLNEGFEGTWPPAGWQVVNNGGDCVWQPTNAFPTPRPNYANNSVGIGADADSDKCGSGTTMDTDLITPPLDLSGATTSATLDFRVAYNDIATGGDVFQVNISSDGGSNWTQLLSWDEDHSPSGPGEAVQLDISAYASNNVLISFHYGVGTYDWWAIVDDVVVTASPLPVELQALTVE